MASEVRQARGGVWRSAVVRDPDEHHRASTPLELFFDLAVVVAVAQAAHSLETMLVEHRYADGLVGFGMTFAALWWAWMNFTWFATAHDTGDVLYRVLTFVQIGGALVMAAGIPAGIEDRDFAVLTLGYVVMRVALVAQWLRVRASVPEQRERAGLYATGILVIQVLWVARLATPDSWQFLAWFVLMGGEVLVPVIAERRSGTGVFHLGHIAERYGLFTIIVLGESLLGATVAVRDAVDEVGMSVDALGLSAGALVVAFCAWWLYFNRPGSNEPAPRDTVFGWGYGHLLVFASLTALGSGVQLTAAWLDHHAGTRLAALGFGVPAAAYLVSLTAVDVIARGPRAPIPVKVVEVSIILAVALVAPVLVTVGVTAAVFVVAVVVLERSLRSAPAVALP